MLLETTLQELKTKSHKQHSKEALSEAVDHYLSCKKEIIFAALQTARNNLKKDCSKEIVKQIDEALEEEK